LLRVIIISVFVLINHSDGLKMQFSFKYLTLSKLKSNCSGHILTVLAQVCRSLDHYRFLPDSKVMVGLSTAIFQLG